MATHDRPEGSTDRAPGAELRDVAGYDTVTEPTIRVPVPAPGWIVIVAGTADRASAAELPRAAFRDPALTRMLSVLDAEMSKASE